MSRKQPSYTKAEQFSNLSRQENRNPIEDDEMDGSFDDVSNQQTALDSYLDGMDEFKNLPQFFKSIFIKLAKKQASLKCRLINNGKKLLELNNYHESSQLPQSIKFQIKSFEKRYTDVEIISSLTEKLIESEKTRLLNQNKETEECISERVEELTRMLKPILDNSSLFKTANLNSELILDSLIESEFCTMLLKMENDNYLKERKKVKFLLQRSKSKEPVVITKQQLQQLNKQIKSLELKLKQKPKNVNGKPGMKKPGKPKTRVERKKSKYLKGNGNSKSMRKDLQ